MDDLEIIELYWERSEKAIAETTIKYGKFCKSIAYNILFNHDDADECVNDTYLRTWNSIPEQRPIIFLSYLGKIVRNISLNKYRERKAVKRGGNEVELLLSELDDCIISNANAEQECEDAILSQIISDFLFTVSADTRIIFVRRYWYADSIVTISKQYNMKESKVKSILYRMRNKLKLYLEKEGVVL